MLSSIRKNSSLLFFLLFLFVLNIPATAQNNEEPLSQVIKEIEKRYDVRFSYTTSTIKNQQTTRPPENATLEETLNFLKNKTDLEFKLIDDRYIAIYQDTIEGDLSVCGTLINTETGRPIAGATVIGKASAMVTDKAGFFSMNGITADETLTVNYLGFDVKRINGEDLIQEDGCPLVFTSVSINFLETVVVENFIANGISKNADGSVSLSEQNFEILPSLIEPDVLQIAQILPGVESTDETAGNINIRGGKNDEVLILWNEIRLFQTSHFFGLISALNPNLTNDVTIYKNGTHPRFGESTSGVLSITSDDTVTEEVTGGASINFISANLYARAPLSEKFGFNISGRTSINSGIGNPVYDQFFNRIFQNTLITNLENNSEEGLRSSDEKFDFYDLSLKAIWDISAKDKLTFSYLGISNKLDFTELFIAPDNSSSNQSTLEQSSNVNGVQWTRNWSEKFSTRFNWHGSNFKLEESNLEVNNGVVTTREDDVSEREIKLQSTYRFSKNTSVTGGFASTNSEINNALNEVVESRSSLDRNSYFINGRWKSPDQNTLISAGARYTSYPDLNVEFLEPRFSLYQKLSKRWSINLTGEAKHQGVFQFTDVNNPFLGVENKRWILADNMELPIMESRQIALGATFKKRSWTVSGNVFYKLVDEISSITQGFRNQFIDVCTTGSYDAYGVEVSVNKRTKNLNAWFSYSYLQSDFDFPELQPSVFPNSFAITHSANLAATYSYKSFLFSLGSTFKTGNPFTSVAEGNEIAVVNGMPTIHFNLPNAERQADYFRTDFSAAYSLKLDETFDGKINLALLNIFDRKNTLETFYRLETDSDGNSFVNKIEQFSLGFTPNISLQLLF